MTGHNSQVVVKSKKTSINGELIGIKNQPIDLILNEAVVEEQIENESIGVQIDENLSVKKQIKNESIGMQLNEDLIAKEQIKNESIGMQINEDLIAKEQIKNKSIGMQLNEDLIAKEQIKNESIEMQLNEDLIAKEQIKNESIGMQLNEYLIAKEQIKNESIGMQINEDLIAKEEIKNESIGMQLNEDLIAKEQIKNESIGMQLNEYLIAKEQIKNKSIGMQLNEDLIAKEQIKNESIGMQINEDLIAKEEIKNKSIGMQIDEDLIAKEQIKNESIGMQINEDLIAKEQIKNESIEMQIDGDSIANEEIKNESIGIQLNEYLIAKEQIKNESIEMQLNEYLIAKEQIKNESIEMQINEDLIAKEEIKNKSIGMQINEDLIAKEQIKNESIGMQLNEYLIAKEQIKNKSIGMQINEDLIAKEQIKNESIGMQINEDLIAKEEIKNKSIGMQIDEDLIAKEQIKNESIGMQINEDLIAKEQIKNESIEMQIDGDSIANEEIKNESIGIQLNEYLIAKEQIKNESIEMQLNEYLIAKEQIKNESIEMQINEDLIAKEEIKNKSIGMQINEDLIAKEQIKNESIGMQINEDLIAKEEIKNKSIGMQIDEDLIAKEQIKNEFIGMQINEDLIAKEQIKNESIEMQIDGDSIANEEIKNKSIGMQIDKNLLIEGQSPEGTIKEQIKELPPTEQEINRTKLKRRGLETSSELAELFGFGPSPVACLTHISNHDQMADVTRNKQVCSIQSESTTAVHLERILHSKTANEVLKTVNEPPNESSKLLNIRRMDNNQSSGQNFVFPAGIHGESLELVQVFGRSTSKTTVGSQGEKFSSSVSLLLKGGQIVNDDSMFFADVLLDAGFIKEIGINLPVPSGCKVVDVSGKMVIPGGIDVYTHFQSSFAGKSGNPVSPVSADDFFTGSKAALAGGTTTVINTVSSKPNESLTIAYDQCRSLADPKIVCNFALSVIVGQWSDRAKTEMVELTRDKGVNSFVFNMAFKDEGYMLRDDALYQAFGLCRHIGALARVHAENGDIIHQLEQRMLSMGITGPEGHLQSRPEQAESEAVGRACILGSVANCAVSMLSVSNRISAQVLADHRRRGIVVFGEVSAAALGTDGTHYFNKCWRHAAGHVVSPPLCPDGKTPTELMNMLASGDLFLTASGHRTFTNDQRSMGAVDFTKIPNGVNGVEERMSVVWHKGVHSGQIDPMRFVAITSTNAAKLFNIYPNKGRISVGSDADLVVWDGMSGRKMSVKGQQSAGDFNVFEGLMCHGSPVLTICGGRIAFRDGQLLVPPGSGKYLPLKTFSPHAFTVVTQREQVCQPEKVDRSDTPSIPFEPRPISKQQQQQQQQPNPFHSRPITSSGGRNQLDSSFTVSGVQIDDDEGVRAATKVSQPPGGKSSALW